MPAAIYVNNSSEDEKKYASTTRSPSSKATTVTCTFTPPVTLDADDHDIFQELASGLDDADPDALAELVEHILSRYAVLGRDHHARVAVGSDGWFLVVRVYERHAGGPLIERAREVVDLPDEFPRLSSVNPDEFWDHIVETVARPAVRILNNSLT